MPSASSLNTAGNREYLTNTISRLSPQMAPLTSLCRTKTATGHTPTWQTDALKAPKTTGRHEGQDAKTFENKAKNRTTLQNYIQIYGETYGVTDVQEAIQTAGVPSELARSKATAMLDLKLSMEASFGSANDRQLEGGEDEWRTRGILRWLGSDGTSTGQHPTDVPSRFRCQHAFTTSTLTEATLSTGMQAIFNKTGTLANYVMIGGTGVKDKVINFTRAEGATTAKTYQVSEGASTRKMTYDVTIYDSAFGKIAIMDPSVYINRTDESETVATDSGLLLNPEQIACHYLVREKDYQLDDEGGGPRGLCKLMAAFECTTPHAHGYFQ